MQTDGLSQRQACLLVDCPRKNGSIYIAQGAEDPLLVERVKAIAERWPRFDYRRLMIMLRRDRVTVTWRRFRRLYRAPWPSSTTATQAPPALCSGSRDRPGVATERTLVVDFIHDRLNLGRPFRAMVVIDNFTCECLAVEIAFSFGSRDVIRVLEGIGMERTLPTSMRFDRGSEFTNRAMLQWSAERNIGFQFSNPGKPTQNAQVESLNGKIRDELLNLHGFANVFDARTAAEQWRIEYNDVRPHSALGYRTPREFARQSEFNPSSQFCAA